MNNRILFVDDETTLLRSMERAFGLDYDVATAESGANAITRLQQQAEPFPVVVTDMRMPGMDGVEFIKRARRIAPDSIYIMLTGNHDLATATHAVNEGQVFRFLNKPCNTDDLGAAIEAAIRYFNLLHGERELMNKTFVGAVSVVTGVLERSHPALSAVGSTVGEVISQISREIGLGDHWEFKMAGKLSLVGFAVLGDEYEAMHQAVDPISTENRLFWRAAAEASRLIDQIPRLEVVAKIIEGFPSSDGTISDFHPSRAAEIEEVGASLLRISLQVSHALYQGVAVPVIAEEVRDSLPNLQGSVYEALKRIDVADISVNSVATPMRMLTPGMVLHRDLQSPSGDTLVDAGRRVDAAALTRIERAFADESTPMVSVTTSSFEAFCAGAAL